MKQPCKMNNQKSSTDDLKELELLELRKCNTVNDIVLGMCKCSFGARCLGEMVDTLEHIIKKKAPLNIIIFEGELNSALGKLLQDFAKKYSFKLMTANDYTKLYANSTKTLPDNLLVLGRFSEAHESFIYKGAKYNTLFINKERLCIPGQVKDGYFPNVLFNEPNYAMPIICAALDERFSGKKMTATQLIEELEKYGGLSSKVADGAKNFSRIVNDPTYTVFMTMSGAMTIAQMSYVICDMMDAGMIQSFTTTGAAMAHGLVESMGLKHYKYNPEVSDTILAKQKLNRVTDTLEPETNFDHIEEILTAVLDKIPRDKPISPSILHAAIRKHLAEKFPNERGVLKSAYEKGIPVFVPAFFDSELGNDITTYNVMQVKKKKQPIMFNLELDNHKLVDLVQNAKRMGIFTVGGGVPRNWTQNVAPLIEIMNDRTGAKLKELMYSSGIRIAPDAMDLGHLSGCTYSEGITWRKMDPNGMFVEIQSDATYVWPFIVKYAMENLKKKK